MFKHLIDAAKGKHPLSAKRSSHWPTVRKQHLALHPVCERCGGSEKLEVHHVKPFNVHPELELSPVNLVTLCESNKGGVNCHLAWGHLGNYKSWNVNVIEDAQAWREKIANRPTKEA
jgi:hypothetical protein